MSFHIEIKPFAFLQPRPIRPKSVGKSPPASSVMPARRSATPAAAVFRVCYSLFSARGNTLAASLGRFDTTAPRPRMAFEESTLEKHLWGNVMRTAETSTHRLMRAAGIFTQRPPTKRWDRTVDMCSATSSKFGGQTLSERRPFAPRRHSVGI
jgi:hypothetical protein